MMAVGDRIKAARESRGMTQSDLGKLCGVTKQTIFKYENKIITNIPLDRLKIISDSLNVSTAWLMDWETDDGGVDIGLAQLETGMSEDEVCEFIGSKKAMAPSISDEAMEVALAYMSASPAIQSSVRKLLDLDYFEIKLAARGNRVEKLGGVPDQDEIEKAISETPSET